MRILVIQTAFIGDVVLTTPFLEALRQKWPDAAIDVVATPQGCEILKGLAGVTCHALDKRQDSVLGGVKKILVALGRHTEFDFIFVVHRSLRSLALAKKVKARRKLAFRSFWSMFFKFETIAYPPYDEKVHYADKPLALLRLLGPVQATPDPKLAVDAADVASVREKLGGFAGGYVVLSPFSVWGTKMWFADRFARTGIEIFKRLGLPVVLVGSKTPLETVTAQTIVAKVTDGGGQALSLVGQTSLGELKALIRGARLVLANDSAPVHIAAAFQVPTVAIFGPTARKWGFFPLSKEAVVVERTDVACRPCHIHGPQKCPLKHFRCMSEIQVEDVVQAVQNLIK